MATAASPSGKAVDKPTLEILRGIVFEGNVAKLTCGHLKDSQYQAVNRVLSGLGGKWDGRRKGHVFEDDDARDALEAVLETGRYVNAKQLFGFFETPKDLARQVAEIAGIEPGMSVLEPSAGKGALVVEARKRSADPIHAVEIERKRTADIRQAGARFVHVGDFLKKSPAELGTFDRVIMNPPFARLADVDHVVHARTFVKPGGALVAIMSTSWTFRQGEKAEAFREFVAKRGTVIRNPPNSFKASGTQVETVIVVLYKPTEAELAEEAKLEAAAAEKQADK